MSRLFSCLRYGLTAGLLMGILGCSPAPIERPEKPAPRPKGNPFAAPERAPPAPKPVK